MLGFRAKIQYIIVDVLVMHVLHDEPSNDTMIHKEIQM